MDAVTHGLTMYALDVAMSIDNVFVWGALLGYLGIPSAAHRKVLLWGALLTIAIRSALLVSGAMLLDGLPWLVPAFGVVVLASAYKVAFGGEAVGDPSNNRIVRTLVGRLPLSGRLDGTRFITRRGGKPLATPLLLALLCVELTDLAFSADSLPAVLSISEDTPTMLVAIAASVLTLRGVYFAIDAVKDRLRFLPYGLGVILAFVGVTMVLERWVEFDPFVSLTVIVSVLVTATAASFVVRDS